jgi:hypothetical protein
MDPHTGHLIELEPNQPLPESYEIVLELLKRAARLKLAGKREASVSLTSGGKLSQFAKDKRRQQVNAKAGRRRRRKEAKRQRKQ